MFRCLVELVVPPEERRAHKDTIRNHAQILEVASEEKVDDFEAWLFAKDDQGRSGFKKALAGWPTTQAKARIEARKLKKVAGDNEAVENFIAERSARPLATVHSIEKRLEWERLELGKPRFAVICKVEEGEPPLVLAIAPKMNNQKTARALGLNRPEGPSTVQRMVINEEGAEEWVPSDRWPDDV